MGSTATNSPAEGDLLWTPGPDIIEAANITRFVRWLEAEKGLIFADYDALWRWSVADLGGFWSALWDYYQIISHSPLEEIVAADGVFGARWFQGARVNYGEHLLRHEEKAAPGETAFCHLSETRAQASVSWQELGDRVRKLATAMREMGIGPGDRVVSTMPNVIETAVAMIATVSIGAAWSSAAPEFGAKLLLERFGQIAPKLAFVTDGYSFNNRLVSRAEDVAAMVAGLPSLTHVVWLPFIGTPRPEITGVDLRDYEHLLQGPPVPREDFAFEPVAADHPLWILFSSGTTGLPKAIVHSHAGMVAEHLKAMGLHCNLGPGKRMFFYSTTGWMMWNAVVASLITGASAVLYDGSPVHGGIDRLWHIAAETGTTLFGANPTLVQTMHAAGVRPADICDLSALEAVLVGGSPATPATFQWFYDHVKADLWVTSQSGGTEFCSGLAMGVPTLPVRAAEIQARGLGIDLQVWDDAGHPLIGQDGELVVAAPAPSMPIRFWNDEGDQRYLDSYFSIYPGIWRHGDLAKISETGGVYIYGRSDSTLNRHGVRIGTAEIYGVVDPIDGIADSLIICIETRGGGYYMPLFVKPEPGAVADDGMRAAIVRALKENASPRHVPDEIHFVPTIPYTLTGKKMEVPVRKLLLGAQPGSVASRDALSDPDSLDWFADFATSPAVRELID